jgi:predicted TIM-barrel fold metal-dependent hydrolase
MTTVDVHAHLHIGHGTSSAGFGAAVERVYKGRISLETSLEDYLAGCPSDSVGILFGGKAALSGLWVDDELIAQAVALAPKRLLGFMAIDPTQPGWLDELKHGHLELGLVGVKLMPMYAGFDPGAPWLDPLWTYMETNGLIGLLHTGTTFIPQAPLEYARPGLIDPVAIRHPDLKLILAHMGHPYEPECIAVIRKHPNVYADISALYYRPWSCYQALLKAQEYLVWDKLLLGSDYPFASVQQTIDGLRALNDIPAAAGLPRLDDDQIEQLINRPALELLGLSGRLAK